MNEKKAGLSLLTSYQAFEQELTESEELRCGTGENLWEVIIQYNNTKEWLYETFREISVTPLELPFAILRLRKDQIEDLLDNPFIIYVEKPDLLFFEETIEEAGYELCVFPENTTSLKGDGVLLGIIDSGIDIFHPDFIRQGQTRIRSLLDEETGIVYTREQLNEALSLGRRANESSLAFLDLSGHGTHVAGIAGGNTGIAPNTELIVVKLASEVIGQPNTAGLMRGIHFCLEQAKSANLPIVLNISYGNTYGSHSGTSLLEKYIDSCSGIYRCNFVIGSGNEGDAFGQWVGNAPGKHEFTIGDYEVTVALQLYYLSYQQIDFSLVTPLKERIAIPKEEGAYRFPVDSTTYVYLLVKGASPYSLYSGININFFSERTDFYLLPGIYSIESSGGTGSYGLWMSPSNLRNVKTRLLAPSQRTSLTIPGTAGSAITVGSFNTENLTVSSFSGRGYTFVNQQVKPDLVAPGVNILSASPGGGYTVRTGTSMATPFVSGICALYMQQGITDGYDPYLYGDRLKSKLLEDALPLPGQKNIPNPDMGWGKVCFNP